MSHPNETIEVSLYWSSTSALQFTDNSSSFDFLNKSASSSEHWMDMTEGNSTTDVYNTTLIQTTTVLGDEFKVERILEWFANLTTATKIVVGTLLCLVFVLLIGLICCCCCKRGRCRRDIRRSDLKRVHSEDRHYTLPNQITRLSKLRQNITRRISALWMDREVADGESVGTSRIAQNSPRKDRNIRMPSPSPSLTDRPYMDMSCLTKAHKDSETPKHPDDHDALSTKEYVKPDRKPLPVPPVKLHPKLQNTDGQSSLRLKNISSPTGELGYYSPQLPVKFQAISAMPAPPYSTCQQCAMGHFGHACSSMVQMPIQQSPAQQSMYNNQMYIPEEPRHPVGIRTYSQGTGMSMKGPPWKGGMGHVYFHGNMPYNQCIPEVTDYSDETDNGGGPFFGHQYSLNSRKPLLHDHERINSKAESKVYDTPLEHEATYSDLTELETECHQTYSGRQPYQPKMPGFQNIQKKHLRMSMDLK